MQALAPFLAFMLLLLGGCADTTPPAAYQGPQYPESARVEVLFQPGQIAPSCRVFAELLAFYPADVSAQTIAAVLTGEARRSCSSARAGKRRRMRTSPIFCT